MMSLRSSRASSWKVQHRYLVCWKGSFRSQGRVGTRDAALMGDLVVDDELCWSQLDYRWS